MSPAKSQSVPTPLFVCRAENGNASWKGSVGYPETGDGDQQRWAWEFLRRNARYSTEYSRLPRDPNKIGNPKQQALAYAAVDEFCLRWRIALPVDPSKKWEEICEDFRVDLIGHGKARVFLPELVDSEVISNFEVSPLSDLRIAALQTQILVRLCIDEDLDTQWKTIADAMLELRRQKSVMTTAGSLERASLHDHEAPLRYVRLALGAMTRVVRETGAEIPVRELSYGRVNPRIRPPHLHYILRTVDAIAEVHDLQRDELKPDLWFFHEDKEQNRKAERAWRMKFPFGESAAGWVRELAEEVAPLFRKHLKDESTYEEKFGRISPSKVTEWMRYARWLTLEQGYAQLAKSQSFDRTDI